MVDGSIELNRKGQPPEQLKHYRVDPNDAWHFIPDFVTCKKRELQVVTKPCGTVFVNWFCNHFKKNVSVPICVKCELEDK